VRHYAQRRAAEHGVDLTGGRVLLLCYPRLLGFTSNPPSVYFRYRAGGELALVIYEVCNTFGDMHAYALPAQPGELSAGGLVAATFIGIRRGLTDAALLRAFFALPLVTFKIVVAIHWEALRLCLQRARLVSRPDATAANTILAAGKRNGYTGAASPAAARSKPDPRGSALVH
jgi:DUF1365 family protein